jgi:hypothetical protein
LGEEDVCFTAGCAGRCRRWAVVALGLLLYVLGRSQDILLFEIGSLLWLVVGTLLLFRGPAALKALWFVAVDSLSRLFVSARPPRAALMVSDLRCLQARWASPPTRER